MEIKEIKKELRKKIREIKKTVPQEMRDRFSVAIQEKLLQNDLVKQASTIFLYYALPDEVNTDLLLEKLSNRRGGNKRIILPVVDSDILVLKEYIPEEISTGYQNIQEPSGKGTVSPLEINLAIVPGMAFDANCNRMGRGKGFYDKLLPFLECPAIGLGFSFQIVDEIPCETFDKPLDYVITEDATYCSPRKTI